jgi:glycosyltransferase involved in cell wall biosynthesis
MKLSIVVPIYNEAPQLEKVVRMLFSVDLPVKAEWIFIDDKSGDNSLIILKKLQQEFELTILELKKNSGKGAALREGIKFASGDLIIFQDADFEYDPRDIPQLIGPLLNNEADIVFGSRFKETNFQVHKTYHLLINKFLTFLSNVLSGIFLTDMETCYKVFRSDILKSMNLKSNRFGIEIELTAYLAKTSVRIFEMPIRYYPRTKLQGKKINWKDGVAALRHLIYFNLFVSFDDAFDNLSDKYKENFHSRQLKDKRSE